MSKAGVAVMTQSLAVEWAATAFKTRNPMGRVGRPNELANMAAFLMSDEVANINGEVIAIDGGMGIMGNGTFSNMMAYSENDWRVIREQIQSTNAADRAKRS